jgi:precorrin-2 dehydrogenase/sirohydrochlorin ferrochelatase
MTASSSALFPMFVKLEGRRCVVVGGGAIAQSKVESLLASGAKVIVVSPNLTPVLARKSRLGEFTWYARRFDACDLHDAFLVIAATADDAVNEWVYREADRRGILCNAVDQPPRCHFYFAAVVRRGALQIAISTSGLSPSLAQRLRQELEAEIAPEYEEWLGWLGRVRVALMERGLDFTTRKQLLARFASREIFERWQLSRKRKRTQQEAA